MTMIARVADGLPLAATMQEDEQVSSNCQSVFQILQDHGLFRKLFYRACIL